KMQDVITCDGAEKIPAVDTNVVMQSIVESMVSVDRGLIAATVQETDLAGHAQDVDRYAQKNMEVDRALSTVLERLSDEDLLILRADHGKDPTSGQSQHTSAKTCLQAYGRSITSTGAGKRDSLSDIGATVA